MDESISIMPDSSSPARLKFPILDILPDIPVSKSGCWPRISQKIDLILLAIEALELGGSEYMLALAKELEFEEIIKNRVVLWRMRCTNPWRRSYKHNNLKSIEAKALVVIACYLARRLTVTIRQLLLAEQQMREKGLPLDNNFSLSEYLERFRAHFRSRMNPRRAKVSAYISSQEKLNELAIELLNQLLFCTGTTGMQRFWISLFDGEVT